MDAVVALLHPEVTFTGDSNRRAPTRRAVIHGADKVARFLFGLARATGRDWLDIDQLGWSTASSASTPRDAAGRTKAIQALTSGR